MLHKIKTLFPIMALAVLVSACGSSDKAPVYVNDIQVDDRWESYNRYVFDFNDTVDEFFLEPLAKGYRAITPDFAETGIRNMLRNLRSPLDLGNQLLQGDFEGGLEVVTRTLINTSFGVGGFVDLAGHAGIPYEREDFGQTLAVWGVDYGPYFVAPLYGPGTIRDHSANVAENIVNPLRLYLFNTDDSEIYYAITATGLIGRRAELLDVLADLKESSIDYYAAVRSLYYQNRNAEIQDMDEDSESLPDVPDFDEEF